MAHSVHGLLNFKEKIMEMKMVNMKMVVNYLKFVLHIEVKTKSKY